MILFMPNFNLGGLEAPFWYLGDFLFALWVTMLVSQGSTGTHKGTPWGPGLDSFFSFGGFVLGRRFCSGCFFVLA